MAEDAVMRAVRNVFFACKDFTSAHFDDGVGASALPNLRTAIAAFEAASGGGWRPIETAPKDGTFVLSALPSGHITISQFCRDGYWRRDVFSELKQMPTHWQPLPPPPKDPAT